MEKEILRDIVNKVTEDVIKAIARNAALADSASDTMNVINAGVIAGIVASAHFMFQEKLEPHHVMLAAVIAGRMAAASTKGRRSVWGDECIPTALADVRYLLDDPSLFPGFEEAMRKPRRKAAA